MPRLISCFLNNATTARHALKSFSAATRARSIATSPRQQDEMHQMEALVASFDNGEIALKNKSFRDLVRSYFVLRLCCYDIFANNAYKIFTWLRWMLGPSLFSLLFRPTVYSNFIAGDNPEEIRVTASALNRCGLLPLVSPMLEENPDAEEQNEATYTRNMDTIRQSIEICGELEATSKGPRCLAVKLTAILPASLLRNLTIWLGEEERITPQVVRALSAQLLGEGDEPGTLSLSPELTGQLCSAAPRLLWLGKECERAGVSVYIDAEYSQLQPGVRLLTLAIMNIFNTHRSIVWNTYQCYLKKTESHVINDTNLATLLGFRWGGKVVRGAYIHYEALRAEAISRPSPVHDSYQLTNAAYDRTAAHLLRGRVAEKRTWDIILATHNRDSVLKACQMLAEDKADQNCVYFGQLAGMAEGLSLGLAQAGYSVYKLVPTGSIDEVLPWLARRMAENRAVMAGATRDRNIIRAELWRRMTTLKN